MAINQLRYAQLYEKYYKETGSHEEAHKRAAAEAAIPAEGKMPYTPKVKPTEGRMPYVPKVKPSSISGKKKKKGVLARLARLAALRTSEAAKTDLLGPEGRRI